MAGTRASIFETEGDFDVSGFAPQPAVKPAARPEQVRAVSEAAQFRSREPNATPLADLPKQAQRRRRTGRNIQLNIKARAEAIQAFYAIADREGWVLGEVFEKAIAALERDLGRQK